MRWLCCPRSGQKRIQGPQPMTAAPRCRKALASGARGSVVPAEYENELCSGCTLEAEWHTHPLTASIKVVGNTQSNGVGYHSDRLSTDNEGPGDTERTLQDWRSGARSSTYESYVIGFRPEVSHGYDPEAKTKTFSRELGYSVMSIKHSNAGRPVLDAQGQFELAEDGKTIYSFSKPVFQTRTVPLSSP